MSHNAASSNNNESSLPQRHLNFSMLHHQSEANDNVVNNEISDEEDILELLAHADKRLQQWVEYLLHNIRTLSEHYNAVFTGSYEWQNRPLRTRENAGMSRIAIDKQLKKIDDLTRQIKTDQQIAEEDQREFRQWVSGSSWTPTENRIIRDVIELIEQTEGDAENVLHELNEIRSRIDSSRRTLFQRAVIENNTVGPTRPMQKPRPPMNKKQTLKKRNRSPK